MFCGGFNISYGQAYSPSTDSIESYVYRNFDSILKEFQFFVGDTLIYEPYIYVDDLSYMRDDSVVELGVFESSGGIIISSEEKYLACEVKYLPKFYKNTIASSNRFVKGVIIHEISHAYFRQIIFDMKNKNKFVHDDYAKSLHKKNYCWGEEFIEEGFCEYIAYSMGEIIVDEHMKNPKDKSDFENSYYRYEYSILFLKDFFDSFGVKKGLQFLVENNAPTIEEVLNPNIFWNRIRKSFFLLRPYS